jgi:inorganic pyrophosphatase
MKKRSTGRRPGKAESPIVADVVVEDAGSTYNRYEYDTRRRGVRLAETVLTYKSDSLEKGRLSNTLDVDGEPLLTLLVVSLPTFPGCFLKARIVGGFRGLGGVSTLVGVPVADASKDGIQAPDNLTRGERLGIDRSLEAIGRSGPAIDIEELARSIRSATEAFWEDRARKQSAVRSGAAWKATVPVTSVNGHANETERYTFAESMIPLLPMRFQQYVEQLLLPEERILAFVERPESTVRRGNVLSRQRLRHGVLVVTDRQLLMMEDSVPPGSTMIAWGFFARTTAIERIAGVSIRGEGNATVFSVAIAAAGGEEEYSADFPAECSDGLQDVAAVVENFIRIPSVGVRRVYSVTPTSEDRARWRQLAEEYPQLAALAATVDESEIVAAAAARPTRLKGVGPALLATDTELLLYGGGAKLASMPEHRVPIAQISSIEVLHSLMGTHLDVFFLESGAIRSLRVSYLYPDSEPFIDALLAVRTLLGKPVPEKTEVVES